MFYLWSNMYGKTVITMMLLILIMMTIMTMMTMMMMTMTMMTTTMMNMMTIMTKIFMMMMMTIMTIMKMMTKIPKMTMTPFLQSKSIFEFEYPNDIFPYGNSKHFCFETFHHIYCNDDKSTILSIIWQVSSNSLIISVDGCFMAWNN